MQKVLQVCVCFCVWWYTVLVTQSIDWKPTSVKLKTNLAFCHKD